MERKWITRLILVWLVGLTISQCRELPSDELELHFYALEDRVTHETNALWGEHLNGHPK